MIVTNNTVGVIDPPADKLIYIVRLHCLLHGKLRPYLPKTEEIIKMDVLDSHSIAGVRKLVTRSNTKNFKNQITDENTQRRIPIMKTLFGPPRRSVRVTQVAPAVPRCQAPPTRFCLSRLHGSPCGCKEASSEVSPEVALAAASRRCGGQWWRWRRVNGTIPKDRVQIF